MNVLLTFFAIVGGLAGLCGIAWVVYDYACLRDAVIGMSNTVEALADWVNQKKLESKGAK